MIFCGLDHASNRWHLVARDVQRVVVYVEHLKVSDKWTPDRRRAALSEGLRDALDSLVIRTGGPIHIMAEEPLALRNPKTTLILGLSAGALWAQHLPFSVFWHWVPVSSWQSWAGIKQNLKTPERKAASRAYSIQHGGYADWEEDHFDADCLALYGREQIMATIP